METIRKSIPDLGIGFRPEVVLQKSAAIFLQLGYWIFGGFPWKPFEKSYWQLQNESYGFSEGFHGNHSKNRIGSCK